MGIFLAFQSQCFHTDDRTGNAIPGLCNGKKLEATVQILAALANPLGVDPGKETVTLMNISPEDVDLHGWALADKQKRKHVLQNIVLKAGSAMTIPLSGADVQLSNDGSIITLLNAQGIKVHGVSYTKQQAQQQGWTIVF